MVPVKCCPMTELGFVSVLKRSEELRCRMLGWRLHHSIVCEANCANECVS